MRLTNYVDVPSPGGRVWLHHFLEAEEPLPVVMVLLDTAPTH